MNKFENSFLPAKVEKQTDCINNEENDKNQEETKQYLANRFVEIFNEIINNPNPIVGKPNMQDPEIMRIFINSSLRRLCQDPNLDPQLAEDINRSIILADASYSMNKMGTDNMSETFIKSSVSNLFVELGKIFPEDVMNLIEQKILE